MSSLHISAEEAYHRYQLNLPKQGYYIVSACPNLENEDQKIQEILESYRELEIFEQQREIRETKFHLYVAHEPQDKWGKEAEYQLYLPWKTGLEAAQRSFARVRDKHKIKSISSPSFASDVIEA